MIALKFCIYLILFIGLTLVLFGFGGGLLVIYDFFSECEFNLKEAAAVIILLMVGFGMMFFSSVKIEEMPKPEQTCECKCGCVK